MTTTCADVDAEPGVTESPSATETDATVPAMGLTRSAPDWAASAVVTLACAVSTDAWSTATCSGVALPLPLFDAPPLDPPPVDPVDDPVVSFTPAPSAALAAPADPPDAGSSAAVRAFSSSATCLIPLVTWAWSEVAWRNAAEQSELPPPPADGAVVVDVVGVDVVVELVVEEGGPHSVVACCRLVAAWAESASRRDWSDVKVACSATIVALVDEPDEPEVAGAADKVEVVRDDVAEPVDAVVAVSLVSALANVALADDSAAWAETTLACNGAGSKDASVWPAVTVSPTRTPTAPTVPETLNARLA